MNCVALDYKLSVHICNSLSAQNQGADSSLLSDKHIGALAAKGLDGRWEA